MRNPDIQRRYILNRRDSAAFPYAFSRQPDPHPVLRRQIAAAYFFIVCIDGIFGGGINDFLDFSRIGSDRIIGGKARSRRRQEHVFPAVVQHDREIPPQTELIQLVRIDVVQGARDMLRQKFHVHNFVYFISVLFPI